MTVEELRRAVLSLRGVTAADVVARPSGPPIVRVWTDGTRPDADVERDVESLAAGVRLESEMTATAEAMTGRRAGLGRGLEETIPAAFAESDPSHIAAAAPATAVDRRDRFVKLAIEETLDAVEVRAVDSEGREAAAVVEQGTDGLTNAVATAVALLRGFPPPVGVVVNTRDIDGSTVLTVLVEMPSGQMTAGASVVAGGLPFTVGRAVDSALAGL
jgi:hypothetical protein